MLRRRFGRDFALSLALLYITAVGSLCYITQDTALVVFGSCGGKRIDVTVYRGDYLVTVLHNFEHDVPLRYGVYRPPNSTQERMFFFDEWWHGDNSWWEGVGFTIKTRTRRLGFEWAHGTYWPPFCWQHRTVPITVVQIPFWAVALAPSLLACLGLGRKTVGRNRFEDT